MEELANRVTKLKMELYAVSSEFASTTSTIPPWGKNWSTSVTEPTMVTGDINNSTASGIREKCWREDELKSFHNDFGRPYPYLALIVCLVGMWLNVVTIIILHRKEMQTPVNIFTRVLVGVQGMYLLVNAPSLLVRILEPPESHSGTTVFYSYAVFKLIKANAAPLCQMIILWLTIVTAIFRALYIMRPMQASKLCSRQRAIMGTAIVILCSVLVSVLNIYRNDIHEHLFENQLIYVVGARETVQKNKTLASVILYITVFVGRIIPCSLLVCLTLLLIYLLQSSQRRETKLRELSTLRCSETPAEGTAISNRREVQSNSHEYQRTTGLLVGMALVFLVIEMPHNILVILYLTTNDHCYTWTYSRCIDILGLFLLIGYSFSFLLYSAMSKKFREIFVTISCSLCKRCKPLRSASSTAGSNGSSPVTTYSTVALHHNGRVMEERPLVDLTRNGSPKGPTPPITTQDSNQGTRL